MAYQVALRDPRMDQIVWRSGNLKAGTKGERKEVSVSVPPALLNQQNYSLELTGIPATGDHEFVNSYSFRVVTK